jgi:hypothetical protein
MADLKILSQCRDVVWRWNKAGLIEAQPDGRFVKTNKTQKNTLKKKNHDTKKHS